MGEMLKTLGRVPEALRPWAVLVSACGIGFTTALLLVGFMGIPEQVAANTNAVAANTQEIRNLRQADSVQVARMGRIDCILTAMATDGDPVRECGL